MLRARLELIEHREVAVDDVIDQRVEDEPGAVAQQLGLALGPRAHGGKAQLRAMADGEHVVRADEHADLADAQVVRPVFELDELDRMEHGEQRVAVLLDLRALVSFARILDRQFVQAEFVRDLVELGLSGLEQRDPDEAVGAMHIFADVGDRNVGDLATLFIGNAADEHGGTGTEARPPS